MDTMKRIVHIWQSHYPWEVRVGKINRSLLASGSQVTVLCRHRGQEPAEEKVDGITIRRVGKGLPRPVSLPVSGNPLWHHELTRTVEKSQANLLLVRDIPLALSVAKVARAKKIAVVLDMAEHYPEAMRSWKKYSENFLLRKLVHDWRLPDRLEAQAVAKMDGILVVCEEQKDRLVRDYSYPAEKICVVLNTPELTAEKNLTPRAPEPPAFYFGYHGILCEDRELEVILRGFSLAAAKAPDLRLLIAGGGESEVSLRALATTLPCQDKIRFTGRYAPEQLPALYNEVDFGIVSLRSNIFTQHTLANKFFDYPSLGKPFIFPDIAPLSRLMAQMQCALPFKPGSPESVATTMAEIRKCNYAELAANGRKAVVNKFNWANDAERMLRFLHQIRSL